MATSDIWRLGPGARLELGRVDSHQPVGAPGDKDETKAATDKLAERLAEMQERLYAESKHSLLVVLQAMDTGGKDGTIEHVLGAMNPAGVKVSSFKAPTPEELAHDFLWRINDRLPARGEVGVFNRSHYEDVLVVRVANLAPETTWRPRFHAIAAWEHHLVSEGTKIIKIFLHISKDEQKLRLQDRLDDPSKHWKFNLGDLAVREQWDEYRRAYNEAITRTTSEEAPWFVVPADRKWYRNWAVSSILLDALEELDPQYPEPEEGLDSVTIQ